MLESGDPAPEVVAPAATPEHADEPGGYTSADVVEFRLSDAVADGPAVLAFFPGVFSRTCTEELCRMRDWHGDLEGLEADAYGVSADTPWSQLAFIDRYDLDYPLVSGFNGSVVADYDVRRDGGLLAGIAGRAVYVVDADRTVTYAWGTEESEVYPDFEAVAEAVADAGSGGP